jgi:hypothetical protein
MGGCPVFSQLTSGQAYCGVPSQGAFCYCGNQEQPMGFIQRNQRPVWSKCPQRKKRGLVLVNLLREALGLKRGALRRCGMPRSPMDTHQSDIPNQAKLTTNQIGFLLCRSNDFWSLRKMSADSLTFPSQPDTKSSPYLPQHEALWASSPQPASATQHRNCTHRSYPSTARSPRTRAQDSPTCQQCLQESTGAYS